MSNFLNRYILYKPTRLESFLSKWLPKCIPFIGEKKRIKIKNYFKFAYQRRLNKDICDVLKNAKSNLPEPTKEIKWYDWEWEVIKEQNELSKGE